MDPLTHQDDEVQLVSNGRPWRVLIVDDHPLYRDGLRELLRSRLGLAVVGEAETEDDAFQLVVATRPDVVTVDLSLASGDGLSLIRKIKQRVSTLHVIVISMYKDRAYVDLAIAAGASGYICKQTSGSELKIAFDSLRNGKIFVSSNIEHAMLRTRPVSRETFEAGKENHLSSRELQIFTMIGQGLNTHEIATGLGIAVSTVETYRDRLKTKLNLTSGAELARHAFFWAMHNSQLQSEARTQCKVR